MSDWREIMDAHAEPAFVKHTHNPQNQPVKPSSADIAYENQTSSGDASRPAPAMPRRDRVAGAQVVELVYVEPREKVTPISPEFPPCPACKSARYWISSLGKVVCGSCGNTRFMLVSISYHLVN